jgi:DNA sulfur modification protein DndD
MSFHFRRLQLKDWLVYGQTTTLDFPDFELGRNLIAIYGQNGYGKTSLLKALQFLFHNGYSRDELRSTWHHRSANKGEGYLEVSLEFVHRERLCKLIRVGEFKPWGNSVAVTDSVQLWIDGEQQKDQIEDKIAQMIPRECQQFVLFDGAEITRYAQKQQEEGVKDAIERVLGIPAVRNLREDLGKLISDLENEQADIVMSSGKSQELLLRVERLREDEATYLAREPELTEKRDSIQNALRELDKETAQVQAVEAERSQLAEKLKRQGDYNERLEEIDDQIAELLKLSPLYMLMNPLSQIVAEVSARQSIPKRQAYLAHQKQFLEELLERNDCVCGSVISSDAERRIRTEIERLTKLTINGAGSTTGPSASRDLIELSGLVNQLQSNPPNGKALMDKRAMIVDTLEEIEKDIADLEKKLRGHELIEVQELYAQKDELERQLSTVKTDLMALENNLRRVKDDLRESERALDELATNTDRGQRVTQTLSEARKLYHATDEFVNQLVLRKQQEIEEWATRIFTSITNKPIDYAGVRVRDDYTLEVLRADGTTVDNNELSAGEKEVLAYSFVTALNLSSPDPAPFVMDTPFGHLDSGHREGLLRSLPNLGVQVFLLATDRDLPESERDQFQNSIAKGFVIQRDQHHATSYIEEM